METKHQNAEHTFKNIKMSVISAHSAVAVAEGKCQQHILIQKFSFLPFLDEAC